MTPLIDSLFISFCSDTLRMDLFKRRKTASSDGWNSHQSSRAPSPESVERTSMSRSISASSDGLTIQQSSRGPSSESMWIDIENMTTYVKKMAAIPWKCKQLNISRSCTFQTSSDHWFASCMHRYKQTTTSFFQISNIWFTPRVWEKCPSDRVDLWADPPS